MEVKNYQRSIVASFILASVILAGTHAFDSKQSSGEALDRFDVAVVNGRWFHNKNCAGAGMRFRLWPPAYAKSYYYSTNPANCITATIP